MPESGVAPITSAINQAVSTIDLEIYELNDPVATQALLAAAKRGVKVRVMLEPHTVGGNSYQAVSAKLAKNGVTVKPTPPDFDTHHNVDHAKFMVIDNTRLLFGTGNLDPDGLGRGTKFNNRDFWVWDTRPLSVMEASRLFNADWDRRPTIRMQFDALLVTPDNTYEKVLALIDGARNRLLVYNQELFDPTLNQYILAAKRRGVNVQVIAGNPGKFFGQRGRDKNAIAIQQFKAAGIPAVELTSLYVHGKGIVADNKVFLGSQNFSTGGLKANREVGEIIDDPVLANQVAATFAADMKKG
jgi:phosphatidylserine/phosphatidylglycerophosphate/cardiolipin synthase-like enzyme